MRATCWLYRNQLHFAVNGISKLFTTFPLGNTNRLEHQVLSNTADPFPVKIGFSETTVPGTILPASTAWKSRIHHYKDSSKFRHLDSC